MSKQSTNQSRKRGQASGKASNTPSNKQGQASGKSTNDTPSKQEQTTKPGQMASKSRVTTTAKANDTSSKQEQPATKPGQMPSKAGVAASTKLHRPGNKPLTRQAMKHERRIEEQQRRATQQRRAARTRQITILSVVAAVVCIAALAGYLIFQSHANTTPARSVFDANYQPVDNTVYCDQLEQIAYHHHVHLTIFIDGNNVPVSQYIGIPNASSSPTCFYWLHTHLTDGIIHIEAPDASTPFTLKNFLDVWQSSTTFSGSQITFPAQLASSSGWTVYINGKKVNEDFSKVDISSDQAWHEAITIMYNSSGAKPDTSYAWPTGY